MTALRHLVAHLWQRQEGQSLALFAIGGPVVVGLVGLGVDSGRLLVTRAELQNAADAAALAGGQELSVATLAFHIAGLPAAPGDAVDRAVEDWARKNAGGDVSIEWHLSSANGTNDTLTVVVSKRVEYSFLKAIGLDGTNVSARASVRKRAYSGGYGLVPWALVASNDPSSSLLQNDCFEGFSGNVPQFTTGVDCVLKYGAGSSAGGDFGALGLDGPGANRYRDAITSGATTPYRLHDTVKPETGNMAGPTRDGVSARLSAGTPQGCPGSSKSDMLKPAGNGSYTIMPGCETSPRIVIIPVVDTLSNPQKAEIIGFAFMYLKGISGSGGHAHVTGEFVRFETKLPNSFYDAPTGNATAIQLLE